MTRPQPGQGYGVSGHRGIALQLVDLTLLGVDDLLGELLDLRQRAVSELDVGHFDGARWWAVISSTAMHC
jgi:hypothetical protein